MSFSKSVTLVKGASSTKMDHVVKMAQNSGRANFKDIMSQAKTIQATKLAQKQWVLKNIEESKAARNASNFSEYLKKENTVLTSIEKASEVNKYSGDLMSPAEAIRYDDYWKNSGIGSNKTYESFLKNNPKSNIDDYLKLVKEQSPWPAGYQPKESVLKSGNQFEMAVSKGQPSTSPGRFGTATNTIDNVDYVRNSLAVKNEWKTTVDRVVTYEVKKGIEIPVLEGPVGPQIDLKVNKYLPGGAHQTEILVPRGDNLMNYLDVVGVRKIK